MDDRELLGRYAQGQDQQAFAELVRRHGPWVYAAAKRQVRDGHAAEDVTQAVFLLLSRRAGRLAGYGYLGGWLFRALSYCVKEALRERVRRSKREEEAARMRSEAAKVEAGWEEIAPELEAVVGRLGRADREAVLLRFYEQKPLAEVGRVLGVSEDAARKRVERAVGRLRERLAAKGVAVEAGALAGVVLAHAGEGGPTELVQNVMTRMRDGTPGGIAKGAAKMMAMAKVKVGLAVAALVLAGSGAVMRVAAAPPSVTEVPAAPAATVAAPSVQVAVLVRGSEQERHLYELMYLLRHPERGPRRDLFDRGELMQEWYDAIRQVVEIGKPAVPYLVAELDRTQNEFCMRNMAFTLRAIGDARAVPALLRAMPRCKVLTSDMGVPAATDQQLAQFLLKNSVDGKAPPLPSAPQGQTPMSLFFFHRSIVETDAALKTLTGHSEGDGHLRAMPLGKTEAQEQAVRDVYIATAARWQKWWDQNHARLISDQELATVQLPPAEGDPIEEAGRAKYGDLTQER